MGDRSSVVGSSTAASNREPVVGEIDKHLKYKSVEPFTGERNRLQGFLLQLRVFATFNKERFRSETEKVLWAITLLEGKALQWVEGFLADYLDNVEESGRINGDMDDTTKTIFGSWDGFLQEIKSNFGVMDEQREAERAIESLRQKGSATAYTREFQRFSTKTDWGDEALRYTYRRGLKDSVKDELVRYTGRTDSLELLIKAACEIDNAWYERTMERKGKYDPDYRRTGEGRMRHDRTQRRGHQSYGDPMEIDAAFHKPAFQDKKKQQQFQDKLCFNCGKPGHIARNCKGGNRLPRKQMNATWKTGRGGYQRTEQMNATFVADDQMTFDEAAQNQHMDHDDWVFERQRDPTHDNDDGSKDVWDQEVETLRSEVENLESMTQTAQDLQNPDKFRIPNEGPTELELLAATDDTVFVEERPPSENSEGSEDCSSCYSEIDEYAYNAVRIQAGLVYAETVINDSEQRWLSEKRENKKQYALQAKEDNPDGWENYYKANLYNLMEHKLRLGNVKRAIQASIAETGKVVRRSQQYQDIFAANMDKLPELDKLIEEIRATRLKIEEKASQLKRKEDVSGIDHPKHGAMAWAFCPHDECKIHYSSKVNSGYWPKHKGAVYWTKGNKKLVSAAAMEAGPAKN
jgi:hypothetical protein